MADLVQAFFERDLSEDEHEALAGLLAQSPEAASRYEGLLEASYLLTGLPRPSLPKGLQTLGGPGSGGWMGASSLTKILIIALAGAGGAMWKFWPSHQAKVMEPTALTAPVRLSASAAKIVEPKVERQPISTAEHRSPASSPSQDGKELSVVVDSPRSALVTVRILDGTNREIRTLYTGFVQAGQRSFRWDGLLSNGQPAPAGDYRIDVQSGASHQTKNIVIQLN
ncbi:MAG: FlgD immunoglobulin-like domain containing protein [bacterium]